VLSTRKMVIGRQKLGVGVPLFTTALGLALRRCTVDRRAPRIHFTFTWVLPSCPVVATSSLHLPTSCTLVRCEVLTALTALTSSQPQPQPTTTNNRNQRPKLVPVEPKPTASPLPGHPATAGHRRPPPQTAARPQTADCGLQTVRACWAAYYVVLLRLTAWWLGARGCDVLYYVLAACGICGPPKGLRLVAASHPSSWRWRNLHRGCAWT
jgi:hypothetical protein